MLSNEFAQLWQVQPEKHDLGAVIHTIGWPAPMDTYAGSFVYHWENNQVSIGYVVGLDYKNTYLSPFKELQVWQQVGIHYLFLADIVSVI
jgi:electron-transferring-flavoprotein dehydrogenase